MAAPRGQHALAGRGIERPESHAVLHGDREAGRFLEFSLDASHQFPRGQHCLACLHILIARGISLTLPPTVLRGCRH
jgi:hypothetical protein